jgi:hypothetical protein
MKKLFESWRQYRLLVEDEYDDYEKEYRDQLAKDGESDDFPKQVYDIGEQPAPIVEWAKKNGFTLRELDPVRLRAYLGGGAYGDAYAAVKDGREYAVKIGGRARAQEMKVIDKFIEIRDSLPEQVKKHIIKFYSPEELSFFDDRFKDSKGNLYYVSVAELLQPLTPGDRKKLEASMYKHTDNIEVIKNPFWSNREWGEVEEILLNKLEEKELTKRLFVDALYKARELITKDEKRNLALYAKEKGDKSTKKTSFAWDDIWTKMIMDKFSQTESGKRLINHYIKNMEMESQMALAYILQMVTTAGRLIFFANLPIDYSYKDKDKDPDVLPAGELKSFNRAMKFLRDKLDILPTDIHQENIMRRGDDWVVMDVGLFQLVY